MERLWQNAAVKAPAMRDGTGCAAGEVALRRTAGGLLELVGGVCRIVGEVGPLIRRTKAHRRRRGFSLGGSVGDSGAPRAKRLESQKTMALQSDLSRPPANSLPYSALTPTTGEGAKKRCRSARGGPISSIPTNFAQETLYDRPNRSAFAAALPTLIEKAPAMAANAFNKWLRSATSWRHFQEDKVVATET